MGADAMSDLPDGFVLDQPQAQPQSSLPDGFVMDQKAPESNMDYATGLAQKAAQGSTFGFADEAAAAAGSLFGLGPSLLGTKSYSDILADQRGKEKEFESKHPVASATAEIAGSLPTMVGAGSLARGLPYVGEALGGLDKIPGWIPRAAAKGAVGGAPYGAISEVGKGENMNSLGDYANAALKGGKEGAVAGATLGPLFEGAGKGIAGAVDTWASKDAQKLLDQGIPLTIGETVGGIGKRTEDILGHLMPISGYAIRNAKQNSLEGLNRAVYDDVLKPIGETLDEGNLTGRDLISDASEKIANSFKDVTPKIKGFVDLDLKNKLDDIRETVPSTKLEEFDDAIKRGITQVANPKTQELSKVDFRQAESQIGKEAHDWVTKQSSDPHGVILGNKLYEVRDALFDMAVRHSPTGVSTDLRNAKEAYTRLQRAQKAASSVAAENGFFTPAQFHNAVKATDASVGKNAFAQGNARLQDLSEPAKNAMTSKVPNSGTPERAMLGLLLHGGLGAVTANPGFLGTDVGIAGLYSEPMQTLLRKLASGSPESRAKVAAALRRASTLASTPLAVQTGSQD